tara:strand:+ start:354 stop:653 length:300 start_codon:yes stop_codon:yes gene_type:complete
MEDRDGRVLDNKKQDRLSVSNRPPSLLEGAEGDMVVANGFLYIKANNEWLQFTSINKSGDTVELPQLSDSPAASTAFVTKLRDKINDIIVLFKLDSGDV